MGFSGGAFVMMFRSVKKTVRAAALGAVSLGALTGAAHAQQAVRPMYGNIRPFYGNIRAFYGNIRPFYGNLRPFYGNIRPFWGNIHAFWGASSPFDTTTNAAFWGSLKGYTDTPNLAGSQIGAFWSAEGVKYDAILNAWGSAQTASDFASVAQMLQGLDSDSATFWGKAVTTATHAKTFDAGFANAEFAKYGINPSDPSSLANVDPSTQALFLLDWYDQLMSFTGAGHVDWWMGATGWSPALAQAEGKVGGGGDQPVSIGMLDFTVSNNQKDAKGTVLQYGSSVFGDGHGAAVGSLIMSSIDGSNVMGVLPAGDATITVYDPYDTSGTTNWTDVGKGVDTLAANYFQKGKGDESQITNAFKALNKLTSQAGAGSMVNSLGVKLGGLAKIAPAGANLGVINASLGEPGWTLSPGWNSALSSGNAKYAILVVAAGNDGAVQPSNVAWDFSKNPTLLVVGSVGLDGTISNFSNTPGEACLNDVSSGTCDKLKNHFLVAPGELILVSDGSGGVSRQTGTSLAAPLVTGAIGLLEARWPWLSNYPNETAEIILQSATPIHSPGYTGTGPDPVYGWGELNIAASQSPLNWRNLVFFQTSHGMTLPVPVSQVVTQVQSGNQTAWNSSKLYYTALEKIGNTYRDFEIPLATTLVGQNVATLAGQQMFQSYLTGTLTSWVAGGAHFAEPGYDQATASFVASSEPAGQFGDSQLRVRMGAAQPTYGFSQHTLPVSMDFALIGQGQTMQFGFGNGAEALSGQPGLSGGADFQLGRGGANPLLGLASGGAYANWRLSLVKNLTVSFGATDRRSIRDNNMLGALGWAGATNLPGQVYAANAENFGLDYAAGRHVTLHASLTQLHENSGLLGVQSLQAGALDSGSTTRAASFGLDLKLSHGLMLSGSATVANTASGAGQTLATAPGGLTSTAAEIAVTKAGLFSKNDRLRLTLSKPMQVVAGQVQFTDFGVVDRSTGELGQIVETMGASNVRTPFAAELFYGRVLKNDAEASVFMRAGANTDQFGLGPQNDYMIGYRYKLAF
jgi:hypothetical protein